VTVPAPPPQAAPAPGAHMPTRLRVAGRIEGMDALRGLALLGILQVNIQSFTWGAGEPLGYLSSPPGAGESLLYFLQASLIEGKFYPIFAFLFGVGMALQMRKLRRLYAHAAVAAQAAYRRRLFILLAMGLAHGLLEMEIALGLPSPVELQEARRRLQLEKLADALRSGGRSDHDGLRRPALALSALPAPLAAHAQRLDAVLAALAPRAPERRPAPARPDRPERGDRADRPPRDARARGTPGERDARPRTAPGERSPRPERGRPGTEGRGPVSGGQPDA